MNSFVLIVMWINSTGAQLAMTEVSSATTCYESKAQIEKHMQNMRDVRLNVLCVKK